MFRNILAVVAGIITATLVFIGFEQLGQKIYPLPPGLDTTDHEVMSSYTKTLPDVAFIPVLAGWVIGSFVCGIVIGLIAKKSLRTSAYLAGLFLTTAGIVDIFMLPHPLWFVVAGIIVFIPFTLLGVKVIKR